MGLLIGIGEYHKSDYQEILELSVDRDGLDKTWEDWKKNKEGVKLTLEKQGLTPVDVYVKPSELVKYCRSKGLEINGKSRAEFVQNKVRELNTK